MEKWNRLIAVEEEQGGGNGRRKEIGVVKEHVLMTHGQGQQRGLEGWVGWRGPKRKKRN